MQLLVIHVPSKHWYHGRYIHAHQKALHQAEYNACRDFSHQGNGSHSPQRSAHSVGVLTGGGVQVGGPGGARGLSVTKTSGLSSSKRRDNMRRLVIITACLACFDQMVAVQLLKTW